MSQNDHQARNDATLARHAEKAPGLFARLLDSLTGQERRELEQRLTRGQAWIAKNEKGGRTDEQ